MSNVVAFLIPAPKPVARNHYTHGGAYDRGSADRYYGRGIDPHYYTGATYASDRIEITDTASPEYAAYIQGYNEQTEEKDWG